MRVNGSTIIVNGNMASATLTSDVGELEQGFGYSVQAVYTGAPVGTLKLQASLDQVTWIDVADSSQSIAAAGSFLWNVSDVQYPWTRLIYTKTSGTGTLNAQLFYRGF